MPVKRPLLSALAVAALLAGCGSDDQPTAAEPTAETATTTDTAAPAEQPLPAGGTRCSAQTEPAGASAGHPGYLAVRAVATGCGRALAVARAWTESWDLGRCKEGCVDEVHGFECRYPGPSHAPAVECLGAGAIVSFRLSFDG